MTKTTSPRSAKTTTNDTTRQILKYFFQNGIFAFRNSVGAASAAYTRKDGSSASRYLQFGKTGSPDIFAFLPNGCQFLGVEIKTGTDRLRPAQIGFIANIERMGGTVLVVKSFEDFLVRFAEAH